MINNDALPTIKIKPDSFEISIDGRAGRARPCHELPLAQLYSMF